MRRQKGRYKEDTQGVSWVYGFNKYVYMFIIKYKDIYLSSHLSKIQDSKKKKILSQKKNYCQKKCKFFCSKFPFFSS